MRGLRFALRALAIGWYFAKHSVRYLVGWVALAASLRAPQRRKDWFAACVLALFRDLGATFIKVGQILSARPDLLPPHLIHALETLQDNVGPFPFSDVKATLLEDLGRPLEEVFAEFSPTPIASASVAQVHKARLLRDGGRVVAVKVRRPRIVQLVDFDLQAVRGFARLLELIPSLKLLAPVESVEQFGHGIRMQLDFTIEAANNRRFRKNFEGDREVVFPELVDGLCSERVLVMEFIDGEKILAWAQARRDDDGGEHPAGGHAGLERRKRLAQIGFRVMLKMVFEDGFVHADLHPGNIFVTRDERVALVDLGLVGELDAVHRAAFARYFGAWTSGDGKTMARLMVELSPSRKIPDFAGFEAALCEFLARYSGKRLGEVRVSTVFFDMMSIVRRFRLRANPTFTLVNIAIAVTEGIGKQLDPEVDLMASALPFFARNGFFAAAMPGFPAPPPSETAA